MKLTKINKNLVDILRRQYKLAVLDPKFIKASEILSAKGVTVKESLYKRILSLNHWYTKLLGLDEVKKFQDRVILLQEKLLITQEKRQEIGVQLANVRKQSNVLQDELRKVKRQVEPDKYFELIREETEIFKLEHEINLTLQEYNNTERELFSAFTNAIRDSHEKQRAQVEYTKYFGIILSIAGSFLAFCYSTLKKRDLKLFIANKLEELTNNQRRIVSVVTPPPNFEVPRETGITTNTVMVFTGLSFLVGLVFGKM